MPDRGTPSRVDPVIGVIVVNWNRPDDTVGCLQSLYDASPRPHCAVLVDNGSSDDSLARVSQWAAGLRIQMGTSGLSTQARPPHPLPWLTVLASADNRGFAGGNNLGLAFLQRVERISHFLLLNNDATVAPTFFAEIAAALQASPGSGLVTGTIYHDPERAKVWYAGGKEVPYRALVAHLYDVPADGSIRQTEFVSGCAMLISRPLLEALGPIPECYFPGYSEDAEYSRRARDRGFPVVYAPRAVAFHKVGVTAGHARTSPSVLQTQVRHRAYYVRRTFRGIERVVALAYLAVTKPVKAVVETLAGRPQMGAAILRGTIEGFFRRV